MTRTHAIQRSTSRIQRAWWPLTLLVVLLAVALGGPAACVIHCLRLPPATHLPHPATHNAAHAHGGEMSHADGSAPENHRYPTAGDEPSALTIGVVLPLALLPLMLFTSLLSHPRVLSLRNVALLPPRDPPRLLLAR